MKTKHFLIPLFVAFTTPLFAQQSNIRYEVEAQAVGTTNNVVPFWMRSNQFGSIPSDGLSGSFIGRAHKEYEKEGKRFDWGGGFAGRANAGNNSKLVLVESYAKFKAGVFQVKIGRSKDIMGLTGDSSLTSGSFAVSGNSLGIPKVEISIPEYYTLPIFDGIFAIKGTFSHGWLGRQPIADTIAFFEDPLTSNIDRAKTYLHQKSLYGRLGKASWNLRLFAGFNHNVFWGDERRIYGEAYELKPIETFFHVLTGTAYGNGAAVPRSKIGNQLGSIDLGLEYKFPSTLLSIYRQNIYDVGALSKLANIRDGLNGIQLENLNARKNSETFSWSKLVLELLSTKHQAGTFGSKKTNSGDEDYYNNYFYPNGWSYKQLGLGTPLISPKHTIRDGLPSHPSDYFINNRVVALHIGFEGIISAWKVSMKSTFSQNYGTYGTSPEGHSTGKIGINPPDYGLFGKKNQYSGLFSVSKDLNTSYNIGMIFAVDRGSLLDNSYGTVIRFSKRFR